MKVNKKRIILLITVILLIIVFIVVGVKIIFRKDNNFNPKISVNFYDRSKEFENLKVENALKIGWLQVQGTNVDLPVILQGLDFEEDNNFDYAWRSPNYQYGNNRELIIGHNLINISKNPTTDMKNLKYFEGLLAFVYPDFAQTNQYVSYYKDGKEDIYVIYAVGFYNYEDADINSYDSDSDIKNYIDKVRKNSIYNYDIDVDSSDELITLNTCTRYFGADKLQSFSIEARKVRKDEEIIRHKITTTKVYDSLIGNIDSNKKI